MSEEEIALTNKDQFALEVAQGKSVVGWARKNEVPTSTAYRWANDGDVRRNVEDWRRRSLDRDLGLMARCLSVTASNGTSFSASSRPFRNRPISAKPCSALIAWICGPVVLSLDEVAATMAALI